MSAGTVHLSPRRQLRLSPFTGVESHSQSQMANEAQAFGPAAGTPPRSAPLPLPMAPGLPPTSHSTQVRLILFSSVSIPDTRCFLAGSPWTFPQPWLRHGARGLTIAGFATGATGTVKGGAHQAAPRPDAPLHTQAHRAPTSGEMDSLYLKGSM